MDPFIGEIRLLPFGFNPQGWLPCDGRILPIQGQGYTALFAVLGTTFGGNGTTTFGLPDLRNQAVVGATTNNITSPGLTPYQRNSKVGKATVTLTTSNTPLHYHMLQGAILPPTSLSGLSANARLSHPVKMNGESGELSNAYVSTVSNQVTLNPASLAPNGNGGPHDNHQPYLVLRYCINWDGIYPTTS